MEMQSGEVKNMDDDKRKRKRRAKKVAKSNKKQSQEDEQTSRLQDSQGDVDKQILVVESIAPDVCSDNAINAHKWTAVRSKAEQRAERAGKAAAKKAEVDADNNTASLIALARKVSIRAEKDARMVLIQAEKDSRMALIQAEENVGLLLSPSLSKQSNYPDSSEQDSEESSMDRSCLGPDFAKNVIILEEIEHQEFNGTSPDSPPDEAEVDDANLTQRINDWEALRFEWSDVAEISRHKRTMSAPAISKSAEIISAAFWDRPADTNDSDANTVKVEQEEELKLKVMQKEREIWKPKGGVFWSEEIDEDEE